MPPRKKRKQIGNTHVVCEAMLHSNCNLSLTLFVLLMDYPKPYPDLTKNRKGKEGSELRVVVIRRWEKLS